MSHKRIVNFGAVWLSMFAVVAVSWGQPTAAVDRYSAKQGSVSQAQALSEAFQAAADQVLPAVVKVRSTSHSGDAAMMRRFGIPVQRQKQEGLGSGVLIDSSGIVLTNNHVVKGAEEVVVEMQDGTELYGYEFATDPLTDLAIVRVKTDRRLPTAQLGRSEDLDIGDWVLAIGYPLDLETSVSAGIISAKGRSLSKVPRAQFLQTDAAINPGNSGGPLINLRGEVIGINTAIASQTGGYQGIGFAIPTSLARDVVRQLRDNGQVRRGYLGVTIQALTKDLATQLLDRSQNRGVLISDVSENAPAKSAGLKPGDVITHFADQPVSSPSELQRAVEKVPVGSTNRLRFVRFGQPGSVSISTLEFPQSPELSGQARRLAPPTSNNTLGFEVADLRDIARQYVGREVNRNAVVITKVDKEGLAFEEGLSPGMFILQVRDQPVNSVDEFYDALRNQSLAEGVLLMVDDTSRERGGKQFVVIRARQ